MKKFFTLLMLSLPMQGLLLFSTPVPAYADHCADNQVETSFFGCVNENRDSRNIEDNPIYKLLLDSITFLGVGVGIVVVGGIVYGAFLIVNSNANSGRTQQGVSIIVNAFIGLLLYIFLFATVNYLVPGGLFT